MSYIAIWNNSREWTKQWGSVLSVSTYCCDLARPIFRISKLKRNSIRTKIQIMIKIFGIWMKNCFQLKQLSKVNNVTIKVLHWKKHGTRPWWHSLTSRLKRTKTAKLRNPFISVENSFSQEIKTIRYQQKSFSRFKFIQTDKSRHSFTSVSRIMSAYTNKYRQKTKT